jgi:hypothetical protein
MTPEWIDFMKHSIESHDRQIAELVETVAAQGANIDKLVQVTNQDAEAIRGLVRIAELHQQRLDRIEGTSGE